MNTIVIGGGVVGITTAYFLQAGGDDVTLIERRAALAEGASGSNAGVVAASHAAGWASPHMLRRLPAILARRDPRMHADLSAQPRFLGWGTAFLWQCSPGRFRRSSIARLRLAQFSQQCLIQIARELDIDYGQQENGALYIYRNRDALNAAYDRTAFLRQQGAGQLLLSPEECLEREPRLAHIPRDRLAGAIYGPHDSHGDAQKFCVALASRFREIGGHIKKDSPAESLAVDGKRVRSLKTANGDEIRADRYVIAMGSDSQVLARTAGVRLPVYPIKGYALTWDDVDTTLTPAIPGIDEDALIGWAATDHRFRLTGIAHLRGFDRRIDPGDVAYVQRSGTELFPWIAELGEPTVSIGFRPMTPDGLPRIGRTRMANLFINTGHGNLGWTMACGSARLLAAVVNGRQVERPLASLIAS